MSQQLHQPMLLVHRLPLVVMCCHPVQQRELLVYPQQMHMGQATVELQDMPIITSLCQVTQAMQAKQACVVSHRGLQASITQVMSKSHFYKFLSKICLLR